MVTCIVIVNYNSLQDENQEGKDGSYIYYYMKEHQDSTAEDARKHAVGKISDAWKGLNKECLSPNPFSTSFTRASLNLARMVPLMYGYDDNQRLPILEQYIKSLLHESTYLPGDENQEGKDGSYIYYYMKEHQDSTAEDARKHAVGKISDAWKGLNKECLSPNPFSTSFTRASLNLARMVPLMYGYDDNQRLPILEQYIKSLLHESTYLPGVY
ncbi:hypothetical protein LWI29_021112 [Acer saccharum]|uniref:Uncharacterized protein n=1 Tax=Acer saccharum TaxID=4024 RepID=A0AA39VGC0_ACESA|nr:hypothetical protein LWI29_021112 [Acer saccharum]